MNKDFSNVMSTLTGIQDSLLQVAVYTDFQPQCVIILEEDPPDLLESLDSLKNYTIKRKLRFPLLINRNFAESSLDSYPLEFLDIVSSNYENLFVKKDLLKTLKFDPVNLRLQMEREIKSKWLLTRLSYLEMKTDSKKMANIIALTLTNILPVLKGICYLKDGSAPPQYDAAVERATNITDIEFDTKFSWIANKKVSLENVKQYLAILESLMQYLEMIDK